MGVERNPERLSHIDQVVVIVTDSSQSDRQLRPVAISSSNFASSPDPIANYLSTQKYRLTQRLFKARAKKLALQRTSDVDPQTLSKSTTQVRRLDKRLRHLQSSQEIKTPICIRFGADGTPIGWEPDDFLPGEDAIWWQIRSFSPAIASSYTNLSRIERKLVKAYYNSRTQLISLGEAEGYLKLQELNAKFRNFCDRHPQIINEDNLFPVVNAITTTLSLALSSQTNY